MMPALAMPLLALPGRMHEARDDAERGRLAWLAGGLAVYPGGLAAAGWHDLTQARGDLLLVPVWNASAVALGFVLPLAALAWLALAARGIARRTSRDLALLTLAIPLVFWLVLLAAPSAPVTSIARVATVVILGLAILRGQLLDVDVRVRWTISRSTIAAAFVAVFFIASEGAQQFFGETLGSTYVGIAAAGALVFAMAPLQRVAERLAESAVPRPGPGSTAPAPEKEDMYREAVRLALRDRTLTRAEERHLFRLARGLGLTPDRAHEILVEVEAGP